MSGFWRSWFFIWCVSIGLFGVVLALGALPATDGPVRVVLALTRGPTEPLVDPPLRFSLGVMGGVSIGWAVMLHFVVQEAIAQGAAGRPLWNAITIGMLTWFVIDSTLSVATGYGLNVVPNIGLLGMYVLGLMRSGALKVEA